MRLRIRYTKEGKIRFVGHRDVARIWERSLRRAGLVLAYSEGFSPRPKVHFGLALPTGYESDAEYLDIDLVEPMPLSLALLDTLSEALPRGMDVVQAVEIDRSVESLQEGVVAVEWATLVPAEYRGALSDALVHAENAAALLYTRSRKGREVEDDFKPYFVSGEIVEDPDFCCFDQRTAGPSADEEVSPVHHPLRGVEFHCVLVARPRAPRPTEFLSAVGIEMEPIRVRRLAQITSVGGAPDQLAGCDPTRRELHHDRRTSRLFGDNTHQVLARS